MHVFSQKRRSKSIILTTGRNTGTQMERKLKLTLCFIAEEGNTIVAGTEQGLNSQRKSWLSEIIFKVKETRTRRGIWCSLVAWMENY